MPYNPKSKENLKKGEATRFSGETAAKNGRKGGTMSGQKKRAAQKEREEWAELLKMAMNEGKSQKIKNLQEAKTKNLTISTAMKVKLIAEALKGNIKAYECIMKYSGADDAAVAEPEAVTQDNGFINALNAAAAEVWKNGQEEE